MQSITKNSSYLGTGLGLESSLGSNLLRLNYERRKQMRFSFTPGHTSRGQAPKSGPEPFVLSSYSHQIILKSFPTRSGSNEKSGGQQLAGNKTVILQFDSTKKVAALKH